MSAAALSKEMVMSSTCCIRGAPRRVRARLEREDPERVADLLRGLE